MTLDEERWAEACHIHRWKGEAGPLFVSERLGALALAGDEAGVTRFREIAALLDQIRRAERH